MELILIIYTTKYRKGGEQFARIAKTLANDIASPMKEIICKPVESKKELKQLFAHIQNKGKAIKEFHFIGHAGMYGPMYGTVEFPEQFSPYEIKNLQIPFAPDAKAYFRTCRSARWFAPFFAREQQVTTYGYHWYTAFSKHKDRYKPEFSNNPDKPLYCFGCKGKKSHGYLASVKKLLGIMKAEELIEFNATKESIDDSYNSVVELYHNVFKDIRVRKDEYDWIMAHLPQNNKINVLDIGCGNGALLRAIHKRINHGTGVDISKNFINLANDWNSDLPNIEFKHIEGFELPFNDNAFDTVISLLSFRYLDWDPILQEIERVLQKDGKLLIVDMVTRPVRRKEFLTFLKSKLRSYIHQHNNPEYYQNLKKLVNDRRWKEMLKYNPMRAEHEMKWYLESRFPGRKIEIINVGYNSRIIAFDAVNMKNIKKIELTYP